MNEPSDTEEPSLLSPLRNIEYRRIYFGNMISNFGGMIEMTAAAWLMTSISKSPDKVAWVQTSVALPIMLFSILAGAISDNFPRRTVLIISQSFALTISLALAAFSYLNWITPWLLLTFTFLVGCSAALTGPSWQASVSDLLTRKYMPPGVLLNGISFNISRSAAPALGGIIVAALGVSAAFAVNAVSYLFMLYPLWIWKPNYEKDKLPRENLLRSIASGIRYVSMSPNITRIIFRSFIFCVGAISIFALLPLVVKNRLHGDARMYGIMLGMFGIGGVLGGVLSNNLRTKFSSETISRAAFTLFAVCALVLGFSKNIWTVAIASLFIGTCWVSKLSLMNTIVQLSSPRWVVGRTLSIYMTMIFSGMSLGSWIWGSVTQHHGITTAFMVASGVSLVGASIGFLFPLPKKEMVDLNPLDSWHPPEIAMDIHPTSGPVRILVEFIIDEKDVPDFLAAMHERRRIRVRDGAHNWNLMRDLQHPERWTMSYRLPTWIEYVRHHQRITVADAVISERIAALHRGETLPVVHRMIERQTDPRAIKASEQEHPITVPPTV